MLLKANICQVCGGKLKNFGTYFRCENCDTEYRIDESLSQDDMDAYFRRLNDFEDAERNLDVMPPRFDEAESEFERIIRKYPDWSAGYWGLVRSKFGIKFENDLDGKAVPSCYKSTYEDFCDTDEYNMAVELAETEELRQSYIKWAEYIARVTKEWRQTAQKYDYDVFISFKASEDSDGRETRDAREMHKLYDLIRDKGYRVFFSPVTLVAEGVAGKGSEPYIFNALDKSRALIVYGSKKEYFTSTWVQNEWQRYLRFIKEGKKEKGSLLVLYQGFNPKELPQGLRRIQGIEYGISAWPAISSALEQILNRVERSTYKMLYGPLNDVKTNDPYHGQDKDDFKIKDDVLLLYTGFEYEVIVPENVTGIGSTAFLDNWQISNIVISNGVKFIGESAFSGCTGLRSIVLPNSLISIGDHVFYECDSLVDVEIPNSVINIGDAVFMECKNLVSVKISNSVTSIGEYAFYGCKKLTSIIIPDSVISIGRAAFEDCNGLISIAIPDGVKSIGDSAFWNCCGLFSIKIPKSVTNIGDSTFFGCNGLTNVKIPNGVKSIGAFSFCGCSGLTNIFIPDSVLTIGRAAFA